MTADRHPTRDEIEGAIARNEALHLAKPDQLTATQTIQARDLEVELYALRKLLGDDNQ